jgi:hypothetical protein
MIFCEAEQTLLASFWKKKTTTRPIGVLRANPQTARVGFAEVWVAHGFLRSRTNAFCFFFWKKKNHTMQFSLGE